MEYKKGQALLLVLLAMATLATMVLSVVSRSISEVGVTTREDESLRAFSAAEAGVETGLIENTVITDTPVTIGPNVLEAPAPGGGASEVSTYTANIGRYPETLTKFNYPFEITNGQAGSVWFRTRDGDTVLDCGGASACFTGNTLTLCWGKQGGEVPAVVANVIYEDSSTGNVAIKPVGFDPNAGRRGSNYFEPDRGEACNIDGQAYAYSANVGIVGSPILMRVTMLYNASPQIFGVDAPSPLPIQGRKVSSEGRSGESTRKIDAFLLNPEIPFIFDAALYSEQGLTK